jgi:hypothetical protein
VDFYKLSRKYENRYGPPEEEFKYNYKLNYYVDWIWWKKGMIVTYSCPNEKINDNWKVEETHYFFPNTIEGREEFEDSELLISKSFRSFTTFVLGSYLTKRQKYTLDWIKRRLWVSGIGSEDLKYILEQLRDYGDPVKYDRIYHVCEKVKFQNKSLFKVEN